jgi:hypothetical protein
MMRWFRLRAMLTAAAILGSAVWTTEARAVNNVRFCARFNVSYWDNMSGQDKLVNAIEPATRHWADLQLFGNSVWSGYLTDNCTPFTPIAQGNPANFHLWVTTAVQVAPGKVVAVYPNNAKQWKWYGASEAVNINPTGDTTITKTFTAGEEAHVSLIASTMGSAELKANTTYTVYAKQGCGTPNLSCFLPSEPAVYIGTIAQTGSDAFSKSVVGHEIGHYVQYMLFGSWGVNYSQDAVNIPMCRCDHVADPNDRGHCLQSREQTSAARLEAWGHAYATGLYNTPSHSTALFGYYKNFLNFPGNIPANLVTPPTAIDVLSPFKWMETYCPVANKGVELDWTGTFYYMRTKTANAYSFANFSSLFQSECGGVCGSGNTTTYASFAAAANAAFGAGSAKANHALNSADAFGADH